MIFILKNEGRFKPKYNVVDEGIVEAESVVVFKAVMDELAGVTHWSPPNVTHKIRGDAPLQEGSIFDSSIKAKGLTTRFTHKVTKIVEGKSIEYDVTGDAIGVGKWIFDPKDQMTTVKFLFDFRTNRLLLSVLSPVVDFGKQHSNIMQSLFKACNNYFSSK